jgi:hypothetical protein
MKVLVCRPRWSETGGFDYAAVEQSGRGCTAISASAHFFGVENPPRTGMRMSPRRGGQFTGPPGASLLPSAP